MDFLLSLSANATYYLSLICVFLMVSLIWFAMAKKVQTAMDNYRETFTNTASSNMGDMFMQVDPNQLFMLNLIAIVIFPALVWLVTGDLPATLVMLGVVVLLPTIMYKAMRKKRLKRFE